MVLQYCNNGNLRNYYLNNQVDYGSKLGSLLVIVIGLLSIHDAGFIHKDFHPGNILLDEKNYLSIGDLGLCQPANKEKQKEGVYGVLPYVAPEVLRGYQYTKAADIYSFGIVMNEYLSEEIPYNDIPHDHILAVKICKGFRPKIFWKYTKLLAGLIIKCWDSKAENRPTSHELFQILRKWKDERYDENGEIYLQEYEKKLS